MNKKNYLVLVAVLMTVIVIGVAVYIMQGSSGLFVSNDSNNKSSTHEGTMTCLVPKDTSGPQSLICAIGLKTDDGKYYALSASDPTATGSIPTGQRVRVRGSSTSQSSQYAIEGVIKVETIDRI